MKQSCNDEYRKAGVDVTAGYESTELIKPLILQTKIDGVLNCANNFAGFF